MLAIAGGVGEHHDSHGQRDKIGRDALPLSGVMAASRSTRSRTLHGFRTPAAVRYCLLRAAFPFRSRRACDIILRDFRNLRAAS